MKQRVENALETILRYGGIEGSHHKTWVIDQVVRALTGCPIEKVVAIDCNGDTYTYEKMGESQEYLDWVKDAKDGEDGPETYDWDIGIAP